MLTGPEILTAAGSSNLLFCAIIFFAMAVSKPTIIPLKPSGRRQTLAAEIAREHVIRGLMLQGLGPLQIALETGFAVDYVRGAVVRINERARKQQADGNALVAEYNRTALVQMTETARSRREERDGYKWIKAGVDAIDVLGRQAGIGRQDSNTQVTIQIAVPVLGPAEAAKPGEIVSGDRPRVVAPPQTREKEQS